MTSDKAHEIMKKLAGCQVREEWTGHPDYRVPDDSMGIPGRVICAGEPWGIDGMVTCEIEGWQTSCGVWIGNVILPRGITRARAAEALAVLENELIADD